MYQRLKSFTPWFVASGLIIGMAVTSLFTGGSGQVTGTKNTSNTEISGFSVGFGFYGGGRPYRRGYYRGGPGYYRYNTPAGYYGPYYNQPYRPYHYDYYYYR